MAQLNLLKIFRFLSLSIMVILLDQITKYLAVANLAYQQLVKILPIFDLTLTYNYGAAFSMLNNAAGWQRWLFAGIAIVVCGFIVVWLYKLAGKHPWQEAALSLILGGALGNLLDRIYHGYVIDFILFHYNNSYFPAFNIADSAITIGAIILVIDTIFSKH